MGLLLALGGCKLSPQPPALSVVEQTIGRSAQIETLVAQANLTLQTTARTLAQGKVIDDTTLLQVQSYAQQVARSNDISIQRTREAIGTGGVGQIPAQLLAEAALIGQNPKLDNSALMGIVQTLLDLAQQIQVFSHATPAAPATAAAPAAPATN
ncbi:MAG: hypothetical protein ACRDX8_10995 [Acidimicrobiales bacterium]